MTNTTHTYTASITHQQAIETPGVKTLTSDGSLADSNAVNDVLDKQGKTIVYTYYPKGNARTIFYYVD